MCCLMNRLRFAGQRKQLLQRKQLGKVCAIFCPDPIIIIIKSLLSSHRVQQRFRTKCATFDRKNIIKKSFPNRLLLLLLLLLLAQLYVLINICIIQ